MAPKRISLSLQERMIIAKALAALKNNAQLETSYASELGQKRIDELSMKVSGGIAKPANQI